MKKNTIGIVDEDEANTSGHLNGEMTRDVVDNANKHENILKQPTLDAWIQINQS